MKSLTLVLLAWWFLWFNQEGRVVGPFKSQEECERIRKEVPARLVKFNYKLLE